MGIDEYYVSLESECSRAYETAKKARSAGLDPTMDVEVPLTRDMADRVEGLVGPPGIAERVRALLLEHSRDETALLIVKEIFDGKFGQFKSDEERGEQCIRTGLTILTEGVTAAGTEGISKTKILSNPDGSRYMSVFFAGPIRSAGGTAAALAAVLADQVRKMLGLQNYRPTDTEIERYIEEINLYESVVKLQYKPTEDEIRYILKNCPVCVDGDPTEQVEVSIYRDIDRIETNRLRGGMALVVGEGIAQKAAKILKFSRKYNIGWDWLEGLIKVEKSTKEEKIHPLDKYLADIVGGRPIFAYPSLPGGFRLRYGRCRNTGIAAKAIHPSAMYVLDQFPAVGTQLKIERPGKGTAITPCDTIEPPVVRLKGGDVVRVDSISRAQGIFPEIDEILFLGDILVSYGDFLKSNHPLLTPGFCEEWWRLLAQKAGVEKSDPDMDEALELSEKHKIPLHPLYTYFYNDVTKEELVKLIKYLSAGQHEKVGGLIHKSVLRIVVPVSEEKRILEKICVPHRVVDGRVIIENGAALAKTLGIPESAAKVDDVAKDKNSALDIVNAFAPFPVMDKGSTYIGARMGRPEKAKPRMMAPAPHGLIPIGLYGGKVRSIVKAGEQGEISVDLPRLMCPRCKEPVFGYLCDCGERAVLLRVCSKCGRTEHDKFCSHCGAETLPYHTGSVDLGAKLKKVSKELGEEPNPKMKGVIGMMNSERFFEPLQKAILRAKHHVYVFKDGTVRFDATDVPLTHFKPAEIGVSIEKLREFGYEKDYKGAELKSDEQVVELRPQDVLIADDCATYFIEAAGFVDDLLEKFYRMGRFYNAKKREDLIGQLVIGLAPHTSVAILGRIIGFTKAHVGYAHPYFHTAKRRNADGDEDSLMLLLDVLINFSKHYLPEKRGGTMDAPMVLNLKLDPREVDDEVHAMEIVNSFPLEFYEAAQKGSSAGDVKIETVQNRLGKNHYDGFGFTHDTARIDAGPISTKYTQLKTMEEKVDFQLALGKKIRAVNVKDVAERVLNFHFMRDIYGNLRSFGQQKFRCNDCNAKFRRVPLMGKCTKCGGKLLLTVNKGGIEKYLYISQRIAQEYGLSDYMKQRLALVERDVDIIFQKEKETQQSLADFM